MGKYDELRAEMARMKALIRATDSVKFVEREAQSHSVPAKRRTKGAKASPSWEQSSLRGVPGGAGKSYYSIMKMVQAEYTGTRVVEDLNTARREALEQRLSRSHHNSNTTSTVQNAIIRGLLQEGE